MMPARAACGKAGPDDGYNQNVSVESKWTPSIPGEGARQAQGVEVRLDRAYLNLIAAAEALRANQPGADKTWVAELVSSSARHFARATRLR